MWPKARKPRSEAGKVGFISLLGTSFSPVATETFLKKTEHDRDSVKRRTSM